MLEVSELFKSIQGESTYAGEICAFVRLARCNLRCAYCDTRYAWDEGRMYSVEDVVSQVTVFRCGLVEITGGEPLLQSDTPVLAGKLVERGMTVLVETNGTQDLSLLPPETIRIVDVKCPASGHPGTFVPSNLTHLRSTDQCKFVISDRTDFDWACRWVQEHGLANRCTVILSPNTAVLASRELAAWILDASLPLRLGLQLHKIIWGEQARGV